MVTDGSCVHASPLLQKLSHAPQLFGSLLRLVQPLGHSSGNVPPVATVHDTQLPVVHWPDAHCRQFVPQWFGSVCGLVHTPHDVLFGELQTVVHTPALQNWPLPHTFVHEPQWLLSELVLMHVGFGVLHTVLPGFVAGSGQHTTSLLLMFLKPGPQHSP